MSEEHAKPVRILELHTEIDATPEAVFKALTEGREVANWFAPEVEASGKGAGSEITFAWSEQMRWTSKVDIWEEGRRVRWFDSPSFMGEGTALACEWTLQAAGGGKTRLTLVQSAFGGDSDAWDDLFQGMEMGWTYFLYHLRTYLETMAGKKRHMIASRFPVGIGREAAWRRMASAEGGLVAGGTGSLSKGDSVQVRIGDATTPAAVDLAIPGRILALRMPEQQALLFLEFEGCGEEFHIGAWLSVHDEGQAQRMRAGATRTLERASQAVA
jgi:uncharacterized protein YndB with AHSA1/START domain